MKKIFAVIVAAALLLTGCQQHYKTDDECNTEARRLLERGETIMNSIAQTKKLIEREPAYYARKEDLEKKFPAMLDQAAAYLYDAYRIEPEWYKLPVAIARCENGRGNLETAIDFAKYAISINPDYHKVYETLGTSYMLLGKRAADRGDTGERDSNYHKAIDAYETHLAMRKDDLRRDYFIDNIKLMKLAMGEID